MPTIDTPMRPSHGPDVDRSREATVSPQSSPFQDLPLPDLYHSLYPSRMAPTLPPGEAMVTEITRQTGGTLRTIFSGTGATMTYEFEHVPEIAASGSKA